MIAALTLGSLHGEAGVNSPYLSNQMPRTISTKPAYSVRFWQDRGLVAPMRDAFTLLKGRANYRYQSERPQGKATILHRDMRFLPSLVQGWRPAQLVITSPPYLDTTSFEEDQWLRLWFLGGSEAPTRNTISRDDRHTRSDKYWAFIADMWRCLGAVTAERAHVIIRIGSRTQSPVTMKSQLLSSSQLSGRTIKLVSSRVTEIANRQTHAFRPGSTGCKVELDCHFQLN